MSFCTSFSPHVASTLMAILMSGIVLDDLIIFGSSLGNQLKCPHFLFANVPPLSLTVTHTHTHTHMQNEEIKQERASQIPGG